MCINRQIYWDKPSAVALIPQSLGAYSKVWVYFTKITFGWGLFEGGGGYSKVRDYSRIYCISYRIQILRNYFIILI